MVKVLTNRTEKMHTTIVSHDGIRAIELHMHSEYQKCDESVNLRVA